jgi:hypothetical protein
MLELYMVQDYNSLKFLIFEKEEQSENDSKTSSLFSDDDFEKGIVTIRDNNDSGIYIETKNCIQLFTCIRLHSPFCCIHG